MKGHTVFPAIVEDSHLLFSILTEDGIAASAEPVPGVKCLGQRLERADRLRGKTADEKTRLCVDDPVMTSFAVIKHEPHLPFRYGSIIAGAVYNNMDSSVLSGICYAGDAEKPPVPAVFHGVGASGDTELFDKRSNINGLLVVGKRYSSQLKAISLI